MTTRHGCTVISPAPVTCVHPAVPPGDPGATGPHTTPDRTLIASAPSGVHSAPWFSRKSSAGILTGVPVTPWWASILRFSTGKLLGGAGAPGPQPAARQDQDGS